MLILWLFLSTFGAGFLSQISYHSLFLFTPDFFFQQMEYPAGLLSWISAFFSQFFYIPWLGALLLLLFSVLAGYLSGRIAESGTFMKLFPAACVTVATMSLGYIIYKNRTPSYAFQFAIGVNVTLLLLCGYKRSGHRLIYLLLSTVMSFPLAGSWVLLATAASGIMKKSGEKVSSQVTKQRMDIVCLVTALILIAVVPLLWYYAYTTTRIDNMYFAGIPLFTHRASLIFCYVPYVLIALYVVALSLMSDRKSLKMHNSNDSVAKNFMTISILGVYIALFWVKDPCFNAEMRMTTAVDRYEWEKVLKAHRWASGFEEPTRLMVMYKNLALIKLGREGDDCFAYRDGNREQKNNDLQISLSHEAGRQLFLHYGQVNYCYRWCFETQAENGWTAQDLLYMARSCIAADNPLTAAKYLTLLDKTLFFREWSKGQRQYLGHPELVQKSEEYGSLVKLISNRNVVGSDHSQPEIYLNTLFTVDIPLDASAEFYRVALLWATCSKNMASFWKVYNRYVITNNPKHVPAIYQQAMLLYSSLNKSVNVSRVPFDESQRKLFSDFARFLNQHPEGVTPETTRLSSESFGNTFYNYYYFTEHKNITMK